MNKQTKIVLSLSAIAVIATLAVFTATPHNYEDCLLANIDKADNPQASIYIKQACREKFPLPSISYEEAMGLK